MKWHKVVFDNEQISAGELREFQDDCIELYRAFYSPKGMVLLINDRPTDSKLGMETSVYFSPGCLLYAQPLISHYSGEPCEQPDMKDVAVFLGNPDEIESHQ
jgi:hypothetical protein